jgi:hypothetical protein
LLSHSILNSDFTDNIKGDDEQEYFEEYAEEEHDYDRFESNEFEQYEESLPSDTVVTKRGRKRRRKSSIDGKTKREKNLACK